MNQQSTTPDRGHTYLENYRKRKSGKENNSTLRQLSSISTAEQDSILNTSNMETIDYLKNENIRLQKVIMHLKLDMQSLIEQRLQQQGVEWQLVSDQYKTFIQQLLQDKTQLSGICADNSIIITKLQETIETQTKQIDNQSQIIKSHISRIEMLCLRHNDELQEIQNKCKLEIEQYQGIVNETIQLKNQCIDQLNSIIQRRHIASPRKDHSPNYFYHQAETSQPYRRNLDRQITDVEDIAKSARLSHNNNTQHYFNQQSNRVKTDTNENIKVRLNSSMHDKNFIQSNIFEGIPQVKYPIPVPIEKDDVSPQDPRFSVGATSNKGYNIRMKQHAANSNQTLTLDFVSDGKPVDDLAIKKSLLKQGIQVADLQMSNPLYSGNKAQQGKIVVRTSDNIVPQIPKELEKLGLKTKATTDQHNRKQVEKTWLGQRIAYAKIGYFDANRNRLNNK